MRKLNIGLVLLLVVLCIVLISAVNAQRPEQHFEYAKVTVPFNLYTSWQTETDTYDFKSGNDFASNCRDMLIKLGGDSEQIGRIRLVSNQLGMLNFLGEHGWELVSSYMEGRQTNYILKRLIN